MKLIPLADRVVLKQVKAEEKTKSGLILSSAAQEKPEIFEVIEVGPGGIVDGKEVVMTVEKGQKVITGKYTGTNVKIEGEELLIVKLSDVSQQETVRKAVEARIATQKNTFEGYGVEQFALLSNNAVVELRGNYVLFVVNAASADALRAFLAAL